MDKGKLFERFKHSRFTRQGEQHAADEKFLEKLKRASLRLGHHVKKAGEQVGILIELVFGKDANLGNRISAISALVYFISPFDFIPDIIPGLGYTDDIAIIGMVVGMVTKQLIQSGKKLTKSEQTEPEVRQAVILEEVPVKKKKKPWLDNKIEQVFSKVGQELERNTQAHIDRRVKAQLIIVSISLGGAIAAAVITLLLKYVFKVI